MAVPTTFDEHVDEAVIPMAAARATAVAAAVKTMRTAVVAEMTTHGSSAQDKLGFETQIIDVIRRLGAQMVEE